MGLWEVLGSSSDVEKRKKKHLPIKKRAFSLIDFILTLMNFIFSITIKLFSTFISRF